MASKAWGKFSADDMLAPFSGGGISPSCSYQTTWWCSKEHAGGVVGGEHAEGHDDVDAAVAVHVDGAAVDGLGRVVDDVLLPALVGGVAAVAVPGDLVADAGGGDEVEVAVAVYVDGVDVARFGDVVLDDVLDPAVVAVFVPEDLVAFAPVGGGDVELAVAGEVGDGDVVGAGDCAFVDVVELPRGGQAGVAVEGEVEEAGADVVDGDDFRAVRRR